MSSRTPTAPPPLSALSLREAAILLSSGSGASGQRLRRAVDAQLARRGVLGADRDDVRADVAFALLTSDRSDRLGIDALCAHVALVARNKSVDHHRRRARELPRDLERVAAPIAGFLGRDLDSVTAEVHRRDVSRALGELVGALPSSERLALESAAAGAGALGSGLGRSSHYRALDRARLRLTASVRSRIAGGLALPLLLLRKAGLARDVLAPLGVTLAAGAASLALVLPAIQLPAAPAVRHAVALEPTRSAVVPSRPQPVVAPTVAHGTPVHLRHRRTARVVLRPAPTAHVVTRHAARAPTQRVSSIPDAGLGPCRAAHLCQ
ncbi:MAG TPA: hypothetical protein VGF46_00475 [Gaiellales bacterium]